MILDRQALRTALFGLVGFHQTTDPGYDDLLPSLVVSRSGRKVQDVHPLITIENIDQSVKNFSDYQYPARVLAQEYSLGNKVSEGGTNYEYINPVPSTGQPVSDSDYWEEIDELSDFLIKTVYSAIDEMLDSWINAKKLRSKIKSIYDHVLLFNGVADYDDLVVNKGNFVGLRFRLKEGERSLAVILNKIGHQFDATFSGLNLYLYHSSQQQPLATYTINHNQAKSSQWTVLSSDNVLRYFDSYDAGGEFYLGYFQDDIESEGAQALKKKLNWPKPDYSDKRWVDWYKQYSPFVEVIGFEVGTGSFGAGNTLFDPGDVSVSLTNNYGLNIDMSAKCDISYFIQQEEELFVESLWLSIGKKLLQAIAFNTRGGNQIANQVREQAKKELYHSEGVYGTVYDRFEKAIKSLEFDLSGLSDSCFPCDDGDAEVILGNVTLY